MLLKEHRKQSPGKTVYGGGWETASLKIMAEAGIAKAFPQNLGLFWLLELGIFIVRISILKESEVSVLRIFLQLFSRNGGLYRPGSHWRGCPRNSNERTAQEVRKHRSAQKGPPETAGRRNP